MYGKRVPEDKKDPSLFQLIRTNMCPKSKMQKYLESINEDEKETKKADTYNGESLNCIWSSGKSIASILMAILEDKGHMKYTDKI